MESINELLNKYFDGETSLSEENELKQYFKSNRVEAAHEMYRPLFEAFEDENKETYRRDNVIFIDNNKHNSKRKWLQIISISGIAATFLLAFWFFQFNTETADYAVINGKELLINGEKVAAETNKGSAGTGGKTAWWNVSSPSISRSDTVPLLNKSETPFANMWWDRYAEVSEAGASR